MPISSKTIIDTMSIDRFMTYLLAAQFDETKALSLYLWNIEMGAAFHLPIQCVEVAMRNLVSRTLTRAFGSAWWRSPEFRSTAHRKSLFRIADVLAQLSGKSLPLNESNVTSAMTFGAWTLLLRSHPTLRRVARRYETFSTDAQHVHGLRNRIAHHEPIFRRDLLADFGVTMRLLRAICPATHDWIRPHCRVPALVRAKP